MILKVADLKWLLKTEDGELRGPHPSSRLAPVKREYLSNSIFPQIQCARNEKITEVYN